jgi:Holliday junction resolvasome RuvABC endonuclease subunit
MKTLALDPSTTATGYAVRDGLGLQTGVIVREAKEPVEVRLYRTLQAIEELIVRVGAERLAWEIPVRGHSISTVDTALRGLCQRFRLPYSRYYPSEIKRLVTGHGDADKDAVARAVCLVCPELGDALSEHEYDAVAILLIDEGNMALAERIPDRRQRREFLEGLMRKRQRVAHA